MSAKYKIVRGYYTTGLWTKLMVRNAVIKNWITESEYEQITGEPYIRNA